VAGAAGAAGAAGVAGDGGVAATSSFGLAIDTGLANSHRPNLAAGGGSETSSPKASGGGDTPGGNGTKAAGSTVKKVSEAEKRKARGVAAAAAEYWMLTSHRDVAEAERRMLEAERRLVLTLNPPSSIDPTVPPLKSTPEPMPSTQAVAAAAGVAPSTIVMPHMRRIHYRLMHHSSIKDPKRLITVKRRKEKATGN